MDPFTDANLPDSRNDSMPSPEPPKGKPRTFKCPACAGTVTVRAVGITINAVCSSCSSMIDITDENYRIIEKASRNIRKTLIEIGSRGRLDGIEWEVIGYLDKTDGSGTYHWDEYLLYNPYYGFRFLVHESGHWNFVKVLRQDVPNSGLGKEVILDDRKFDLFLRGNAVVQYVKGEFYWRVRKGETTVVADYTAPPYILSLEKDDKEINVSVGEYIENGVVAEAFAIKARMPDKTGVAPNQPAPYQGLFGRIWYVAATAFTLLMAIQLISSAVADNENIYTQRMLIRPGQNEETMATASFSIPKEGNVLIESSSPVDNDWVELELSLVNERTNQEYELKQAIEYYHGYDGGEYWSEGSQTTKSYISKVPTGNYRLLINMDAGPLKKNLPVFLSLNVMHDVPSWSNFWLATCSLFIYPLYALLRRWRFEKERWSESDYTPAIYRDPE